jgi:hypothetical protein
MHRQSEAIKLTEPRSHDDGGARGGCRLVETRPAEPLNTLAASTRIVTCDVSLWFAGCIVKTQPVQSRYGVGACRRVTGTIMGARQAAGYAGGETLHLKPGFTVSYWCGRPHFVYSCSRVNVSLLGVDDCSLQPRFSRLLMPWCSVRSMCCCPSCEPCSTWIRVCPAGMADSAK